jgi:tetratricopeptide (TPR) repeat protein
MAGRTKEALAQELEASALEPFAPLQAREAADYLWLNGRNDEAIARAKTLRPADRAPALARIYASTGRFAEAADALTELTSAGANSDRAREASRLLRTAPAASPQGLPRIALGIELEFVYLYAGAPERALDNIERRADAGFVSNGYVGLVWHPAYAAVRKTERFKTIIRKVGNVDYWRAKGWPEQCHPTTGDDFVCD